MPEPALVRVLPPVWVRGPARAVVRRSVWVRGLVTEPAPVPEPLLDTAGKKARRTIVQRLN